MNKKRCGWFLGGWFLHIVQLFGENNTDGPFQTPYFFTTFFFPPVSLTADSREIYDRHSPGELPFSSGNLLLVK